MPEWPGLAGILVAVNEIVGRRVFPAFRSTQTPDLSFEELGSVAQAFLAR